ncbi:hypothetical protein M0R45_009940 [Rubus argutus]|uniref:C2H2-type domain-containing protein n=1 Tax=Rubus argutus TaxID=59490 RepID=A0AAW1Y8Y8_RUBAR
MEPDTGDLLHRGLRELRVHCQRCPVTFLSPINYNRHNKMKHEKHGKKSTGSTNTKEKLEEFWNTSIRSRWNNRRKFFPLKDIVEARPSRFPITVNDLFSIMDKPSEGTFLLGELSLVERSMFEKNEAIELIDVVARTSFILEKQLLEKEREYSKLLMQSLEEKANAVAQKLIEEEEANYRLF